MMHAHFSKKVYKDELDLLKYAWQTQREDIVKKLQVSKLIQKSDIKATELKDVANVEFCKHNFHAAKNLYFDAMMAATYNSKVYGIVCSNMSACYFEEKEWNKAITAIDVTLNSDYPKNLRPKLYIRKIKAFIKMSDQVNATKTASDLQDFIHTCEFSNKKKDEFLKLSAESLIGPPDENHYNLDLVLPDMEENPSFPNVSTKVELCTNKKYGRHVISKDVIDQGECILIEKPYTSIGLYRCAYCNNITEDSIIPCKNCTATIYCSESCITKDETIHKWECSLFQNESLNKIDARVCLAYRIFLKRTEAGYTINAKDNVDSGPDAFFNFTKLHKLALKDNIKTGIIFDFAMDCCMIMAQLSQDKHFVAWIKNKTKGINSDMLMIGKDILKFALICDSNSFSTTLERRNLAIYISQSFLNHSCEPNTVQNIIDNKVVLKAFRTIKPGEQLYTNYTQDTEMSNSDRRELLLGKWNFKCECKLCLNDTEHVGNYKCPKCNSCDTDIHYELLMCNSCRSDIVFPVRNLSDDLLTAIFFETISDDMTDELLYGLITLVNGMEINPNSNLGQQVYFEIVARKFKSGDLKNIQIYLSSIRNINYDASFQCHYDEIYRNLLAYTKSSYFSSGGFSSQLDMSTLNCLIDYITFLRNFWNLHRPTRAVLKDISDMKTFFMIQKDLLQFRETIEWTQ